MVLNVVPKKQPLISPCRNEMQGVMSKREKRILDSSPRKCIPTAQIMQYQLNVKFSIQSISSSYPLCQSHTQAGTKCKGSLPYPTDQHNASRLNARMGSVGILIPFTSKIPKIGTHKKVTATVPKTEQPGFTMQL